jgi:predicted NAD/FAD-dependent oxidoreductase
MNETGIAIIGAGIAGCYAASLLSASGHRVTLIEKSRGLGGRCSLRYINDKQTIDLGAASFTLEDLNSNTTTNTRLRAGIARYQPQHIADWSATLSSFDDPGIRAQISELCGVPTMNQLHRALAQGIDLITKTRVERLVSQDDYWLLMNADKLPVLKAKKVIVTAPALQTLSLYDWPKSWQAVIRKAADASQPQWVCALAFDNPQNQLADVYRGGHALLTQAVRDNSKPGRNKEQELWVLHSGTQWASNHLETPPEQAAEQMAKAFVDALGISDKYHILTSHRWLLSIHDIPATPDSYLYDDRTGLGICGDWLGGPGISGALNSSDQLCARIINDNLISGQSHG